MKIGQAIIILIFLVTLAVIHLGIFTKSMEIKYQIEEIKIEFDKMHAENLSLAAKVSEKSSLERVAAIAREELDMVYPNNINYLKRAEK
ncbi:MAG: septum formation initiator family protein [Candidatus Margulisbacteria bacterium]|nr:septum formation initiator family protein [Candidatus Margulisiibacteriota bacterium]MBU1022404.1 septum formation initiator family protein [Candidatus Margulisiibacteriota bacterium]MBU1729044.1 septum formation initiator family protein [Candidatus Margulisiibacteriota bacterium]MBU1954535.1 septum formation initiator family protein [Candidatus Margulisiibacteriota bacterium]